MKNSIIFCFYVFMLPLPIIAQSVAERIYQNNIGSVVKITTESGCGTGFFIDKDLVATNYHVVKGASKVSIEVKNQAAQYGIEGYVALDAENDLIILKSNELQRNPLKMYLDGARIGQDIFVIGAPKCLSLGIARGSVNRLESGYIGFDATTNPGNSGGPVMNEQGEVIGITVLKLEGENLNFAIPVEKLKYILNYKKNYTSTFPILETKGETSTGKSKQQDEVKYENNYWFKQGNIYFDKKEYKEGFLAYGKQIEIKPFKEAYYNAALCAFKTAQFQLAIEYFTYALKWDEDYEDALIMRSKSYYQSCNYDSAVEDAATLVKKKPNEAAFFWCGYLHLKYSEIEHAEKDFKAVLKLNPNHELAKKYIEQCAYITQKFTIARPKVKALLENLSNEGEYIENYYISFTSGDVLHEGLLIKNQEIALLRVRYKGNCGDTKITQQTMLLEKGSTGLEMIGLTPINAETLTPEPFYNTDNFYFDNTAFPPQLWNISEGVKVEVHFKKLATTEEILEGYKMVGLSNDK